MIQLTRKPKVIIFSAVESLPIADVIQIHLERDCQSEVWNQGLFQPGTVYLDSIRQRLNDVDYAIIVCDALDMLVERGNNYTVPRDNVTFEAGLSIQALGPEHVFLVSNAVNRVKLPNDLDGLCRLAYQPNSDNLVAALGPTCLRIRTVMQQRGLFKREVDHLKADINRLTMAKSSVEAQLALLNNAIKGKRLFQHKGYYPIDLDEANRPTINKACYVKSMHYFLHEKHDLLAASDLLYLRESNLRFDGDFLTADELLIYNQLIEQYDINPARFADENKHLLSGYIRAVDDIGKTFENVYVEFILHDVRNPIHSIVAAQNTEHISGRKLGDPSTRFVHQYVTNQGESLLESMQDGSKVAYRKQFRTDKYVKATTTPIYDPRYGLIAILCINIDIDKIRVMDSLQKAEFFEKYIKNSGYTPPFER